MGTNRWLPNRGIVVWALCLALGGTGTAAAQSQGPGAPTAKPGRQDASAPGSEQPSHSESAANPSTELLPCIPVGTYWTAPPYWTEPAPSEAMPSGPMLAVVAIDVRPKDAQVFLDDRFVGRARYLDGKPGYLYLEPGTYQLELRLEGYQTLAIKLEASAGCRFDLKHRLDRATSPGDHQTTDIPGKGKPSQWVYSPIAPAAEAAPPASPARGAPDPSLRPDLGRQIAGGTAIPEDQGASLRIRVVPDNASVFIDSVFVATGGELVRMEGPLATSAGNHVIEVRADGFVTVTRSVELELGETLDVTIELSANSTN
jgi:hypothetical protein